MNFYKRFIGDIQRDTGHLSLAEFGAYDRLLDHYYATETPLPGDIDACCRIARAMTKDERKAVSFILIQYFTQTDDGYIQKRVERELSEAQPKIEANRVNGLKGGRPKGSKTKTQEKPNGFSEITQSEPNKNLSQSQSQNTVITTISENITVPSVTPAAAACIAIREVYDLYHKAPTDISPSNPTLAVLIEAGATVDEFRDSALAAMSHRQPKGFNWILARVRGQREEAATVGNLHQGQMPTVINQREAGIQTAAKSIFKPGNITHLTGANEIEVHDAAKQITA